jgi:multidrug resistance efflux pump
MAKKEEINGIEIYSEEVQDILGPIPGRLINWGATIIFSIFLMLITGSYFFTFNEVISAPMVITTSSPPAPLIAKTSGRISKLYVIDGQTVTTGSCVALINNPAQVADVMELEQVISSINGKILTEMVVKTALPDNLMLGDMQELYNLFLKNWRGYHQYVTDQPLLKRIELLKKEMAGHEKNYNLSLGQKDLVEKEFELAKKRYARYQSLEGKGGVSESELDNAMSSLIQSERAYYAFMGSLQSLEIGLIGQKRALLEMQEQHSSNIVQFETDISENIRAIGNSIRNWKTNYLLSAPIDGVVTLTKFWSENHVISAGERLATVVPKASQTIICRALVSSTGIGKVEPGQKANLKLSGYPFMQYGILRGTVKTISLVPEGDGYIVEIDLKEGMKSNYSEQLKLIQEMGGTAEIVTRRSRVINRFINPLKSIVKEGS